MVVLVVPLQFGGGASSVACRHRVVTRDGCVSNGGCGQNDGARHEHPHGPAVVVVPLAVVVVPLGVVLVVVGGVQQSFVTRTHARALMFHSHSHVPGHAPAVVVVVVAESSTRPS